MLSVIGLLKGSRAGLIQIIKLFEGQRPDSVDDSLPDVTRLTKGNTTIDSHPRAWSIFGDARVTNNIRNVVAPLREPGIEQVRTRSFEPEYDGEELTADDIGSFDEALNNTTSPDDQISEYEASLDVVSPAFAERHDRYQWRFFDGTSHFTAPMEDIEWFDRVMSEGRRFGPGDTILARVEVSIRYDSIGRPRLYRRVLEVLDHQQAPSQIQMPSSN